MWGRGSHGRCSMHAPQPPRLHSCLQQPSRRHQRPALAAASRPWSASRRCPCWRARSRYSSARLPILTVFDGQLPGSVPCALRRCQFWHWLATLRGPTHSNSPQLMHTPIRVPAALNAGRAGGGRRASAVAPGPGACGRERRTVPGRGPGLARGKPSPGCPLNHSPLGSQVMLDSCGMLRQVHWPRSPRCTDDVAHLHRRT